MITTVCDLCHRTIGVDEDRIDVRIEDRPAQRFIDPTAKTAAELTASLATSIPPPYLAMSLDLHRQCYIDHVQPALALEER